VLRPNVAFWTRIFATLDSKSGILHDANDLSIIYHTLHALPQSPAARLTVIQTHRSRYRRILETLAQGKRRHLQPDETRVLALFAGKQQPTMLRAAAAAIRFQQGMRDRFAAGLVRSTAYLSDLERIFVTARLPRELVLLPHVESSFHHRATSKAGAAGLWQFTRATGRRFLRINRRVDERFNVQLSTRAAARLLRENYAVLGTWPLAITAYNHGTAGMQQAVQTVGTKDFGAIVRRYRGPLFGFASRNFYAEFLAAVDVVKHHQQYFPELVLARSPDIQRAVRQAAQEASSRPTAAAIVPHHQAYRVRSGDTLWAIARRVGTTPAQLVALNGLQQRHRLMPGQRLRLPAAPQQESPTTSVLVSGNHGSIKPRAAALPASAPTRGRRVARTYRVRPGDTLSTIAQDHGTTVRQLVAVNGLKRRAIIKAGQRLLLPGSPRRRAGRQVKAGRT
jgi:membrane-bound lytic murein transglycosylase D